MQCYAICITPLVTSRPPPPTSPRAPPPSSPASKRTGKSLGVPVSQSVSPCVRRRQLSVSLPTCAERGCTQGARPSVGFIIRSEATPGLQNTIFFIFFYICCCFFFSLPTSGLEKQPAIMSRAPEDVSKLTESTYKVSEITQQIRR